MMKLLILSFLLVTSAAFANTGGHIEKHDWGFQGLATKWDKKQLKRGYTVATQVCFSCHSFQYVNHRQLMKAGFSEGEVKRMSAELELNPTDPLISALDAESAQETYGKIPPDLSMMNKARVGGADYVYAVLTGYSEDPEALHEAFPKGDLPEGAHFNLAFPGHAIAMPSPLSGPDMVEYADGTEATVEQMAKDVAYFLQWTAEPELIKRNATGVYALLYVFIFILLTYFLKRVYWKSVH